MGSHPRFTTKPPAPNHRLVGSRWPSIFQFFPFTRLKHLDIAYVPAYFPVIACSPGFSSSLFRAGPSASASQARPMPAGQREPGSVGPAGSPKDVRSVRRVLFRAALRETKRTRSTSKRKGWPQSLHFPKVVHRVVPWQPQSQGLIPAPFFIVLGTWPSCEFALG